MRRKHPEFQQFFEDNPLLEDNPSWTSLLDYDSRDNSQWDTLIQVLTQLITANEPLVELLAMRAHAFEQNQEWDAALEDLTTAFKNLVIVRSNQNYYT